MLRALFISKKNDSESEVLTTEEFVLNGCTTRIYEVEYQVVQSSDRLADRICMFRGL